MTRSQEALERRAKKRNLTIENMKEIEASSWNKKQKLEMINEVINTKSLKTTTDQTVKSNISDRWICTACNNSNLCRISTIHCNRCQRLRADVDPHVNNTNQMEEKTTEKIKPKHLGGKKSSDKKSKKDKKNKNLQSSWTCSPATQEQIDENMRLRKLYENLESRVQLSSEELERARILVERSERKKMKKLARITTSNSSTKS